jgi:hypothetical protein
VLKSLAASSSSFSPPSTDEADAAQFFSDFIGIFCDHHEGASSLIKGSSKTFEGELRELAENFFFGFEGFAPILKASCTGPVAGAGGRGKVLNGAANTFSVEALGPKYSLLNVVGINWKIGSVNDLFSSGSGFENAVGASEDANETEGCMGGSKSIPVGLDIFVSTTVFPGNIVFISSFEFSLLVAFLPTIFILLPLALDPTLVLDLPEPRENCTSDGGI